MSFDQLSSIESGNGRRNGAGGSGAGYSDDPEFSRLSQGLMNQLFHIQGNISKLRSEIALLGTKRDNPRLRERVTGLLEESTEKFKEIGEGVKKIQSWEDVTVTPHFIRAGLFWSSHKDITHSCTDQ
jgi:hypothetical protein